MPEDLRERFDRLVPELEERAAILVAGFPAGVTLTAGELVEATWKIVCSKRGTDAQLRAIALRELDCAASNLALRVLFDAQRLDDAFALLVPLLRTWATNLSARLSPRPDPDDLVQDAFVKLRKSKMFLTVDNPLGYAFRAVKNLIIDHARRKRPTVELADRHAGVTELATSGERLDEILTRAGLSALEKCLLSRVVFEKVAVGAAQKECGGPPGAPYYVLEKILDKVATALGIDRSRS